MIFHSPNKSRHVCAFSDKKDGNLQRRIPMRSLVPATRVATFTSFTSKARKAALLLFSAALLLAGGVAVRGQSALDGFDPNANGFVRVVVVQPDGKILIGGDFTTLSPNGGATVTRNRIARLNPDGTLDPVFNPNASGTVFAIAVQADGKILVGGAFNGASSIGGQTRNGIARLDATTGLADSFDPNANFGIYAIAVQADGKILAGGIFTTIGGATRNHLARLDATTGLADSFDPNADSTVRSIAVQADGKILAGGQFASVGGQTRNNIARLDAATGGADSFAPNASNDVLSIAVQADGKILAGGIFTSIGGQTRNRIARLDATTGSADSFDPNSNSQVLSIAVQADGKILAGGFFTTLAPNGGAAVTRNRIARLETDGRLDQTLNLSIVGSPKTAEVYAIAIQPDAKILIGGSFTSVLGVTRNNIARLNTDGTLDTAFNPNANSVVYSIALQADGKILAGGSFTNIGGLTRNRIARLGATTGLADSFNPNANSSVYAIAVQADGKILAGGFFNEALGVITIGGQTRNYIARLDASTGLADSFNPDPQNSNPNFSADIKSIVVQPDGKILVGGVFNGVNGIGGQPRNRIARLDASTGLPDSFDPNANNQVFAVAAQSDGKILAGGIFSIIGGQTRNRIARLDGTTGLLDSFNPNATAAVYSIAVQSDGKILAVGDFTGANSIGGQTRNYIARLDATTGLADSFNPNADDFVESVALQADGKILAGGYLFTTIGGQARFIFARLSNGTAALQNLAVTQTAITWTRGGSSPQLTRVTFESSTDNVNYTPLGNGTATGSNWTLTGLSLPTGQNIYIRARGYYRSGYENGSESIAESVRNAFIAGSTPTPTPTSTPPSTVSISGTVLYCSNPVPGPVPNVTLTLTGSASGSTLSDGSGNYTFSSLPAGGNYTVTPSKAARVPGSANINTVDVIAVQKQFLTGNFLSGCKLSAADVNGDTFVTTQDVIAVQRFFNGLTTATANVGTYKFTPVNRTYTGITTNQTAQNYDTLVFGDVAAGFVELADDP
jgi:uncharacterized delta-60 repeat protein